MTLEALDNYEKEIKKARRNFEEANRKNEAILERLENDLDAVRAFAEEESETDLRELRRQDSELYKAIRAAYWQEQEEETGDALEKHCQGMIAAIDAVYRLGYAHGFKDGAEVAEEEIMKRGLENE